MHSEFSGKMDIIPLEKASPRHAVEKNTQT